MNLIPEYALLIAVALPLCVVVAMNVWLALNGERDTLLFPIPRPYPRPAPQAGILEPLRHAA